jgi:hypothetical protein
VARSVTSSKIMQMNIAPPIFNIVLITTSLWMAKKIVLSENRGQTERCPFQIVRRFLLQVYPVIVPEVRQWVARTHHDLNLSAYLSVAYFAGLAGCELSDESVFKLMGSQIAKLEGRSGVVRSAAFSPDGQRIVTEGDGGITLIFKIVTLDDIARLLASK